MGRCGTGPRWVYDTWAHSAYKGPRWGQGMCVWVTMGHCGTGPRWEKEKDALDPAVKCAPMIRSMRRIMSDPIGERAKVWSCSKRVASISARCLQGKFKPKVAQAARTIREFDDAITIHSFGWESTDQYYAASSSSKAVPQ
eukprot:scaffold22853_cov23-Tisochrysis_lutea.AAC.4